MQYGETEKREQAIVAMKFHSQINKLAELMVENVNGVLRPPGYSRYVNWDHLASLNIEWDTITNSDDISWIDASQFPNLVFVEEEEKEPDFKSFKEGLIDLLNINGIDDYVEMADTELADYIIGEIERL